jgi:arginase
VMPLKTAILEAPSVLGLFPNGVETLADALLSAGLAQAIGGQLAGRVEPPRYSARVDPITHLKNAQGIAQYSSDLADAVGRVIDDGAFPVVLGGDCSILLGNLLALRRRGRFGLLFLDGHADFYLPEQLEDGEAASMDLSFATGRGPAIVANLEGLSPLVRDEDVVVFGRRDSAEAEQHGSQRIEDTRITVYELGAIRTEGIERAARSAVKSLSSSDTDGFWIHLDADVLNDAIMPAVDYRMPGGLHWTEFEAILRTAIASGRAVGFHVGIFNPKLDADGSIAKRLVKAIAVGFESARSVGPG